MWVLNKFIVRFVKIFSDSDIMNDNDIFKR